MNILLFCLKGFETMEFSPFVDIAGWARNDFGCDVTVTTCGFAKQVISTFGIPIVVQRTLDEINTDDYDALAIPGGFEEFGFYEEGYDERFLELIRAFHHENKPIASICVGALPVAKSSILKDRMATTYHLNNGHRQKQLADMGVNVVNKPVVIDNNVITSWCPSTAPLVGFELLKLLVGEEKTKACMKAMGFSDETLK